MATFAYTAHSVDKRNTITIKQVLYGGSNGLVLAILSDNKTFRGEPMTVFRRIMMHTNQLICTDPEEYRLYQLLFATAYPDECAEYCKILKDQHDMYTKQKSV